MRTTCLGLAALVMVSASVASAQQRFTTCSQVAEFAKQQCPSMGRPQGCMNAVEQNRTACMQTGTWQKASGAGGSAGPPITNLRRE